MLKRPYLAPAEDDRPLIMWVHRDLTMINYRVDPDGSAVRVVRASWSYAATRDTYPFGSWLTLNLLNAGESVLLRLRDLKGVLDEACD